MTNQRQARIKRADLIKKEQQEAIRQKIQAQQCLNQIERAEAMLLDENRDSNSIQAAKALADIQFKKLTKVLPDLKSIEHTGDGGGPLTIELVKFADTDTE